MNKIYRICAQCDKSCPLDANHCPHCGYNRLKHDDIPNHNGPRDNQSSDPDRLPAQQNSLPAAITKAALPVLVGAASLVVRAGWNFLRARLENASYQNNMDGSIYPSKTGLRHSSSQKNVTGRPRHTIHIRSQWAVGDGNGQWQRGASEHTIEIE